MEFLARQVLTSAGFLRFQFGQAFARPDGPRSRERWLMPNPNNNNLIVAALPSEFAATAAPL
jgi:hypothetical protein